MHKDWNYVYLCKNFALKNSKFSQKLKKILHILLAFSLTFAIGFWEETAEIYGGEVMYFTNEIPEREKESQCAVPIPPDDTTDHVVCENKLLEKYKKDAHKFSVEPFLPKSPLPAVQSLQIVNNLQQYNKTLLASLSNPKFYILYHCPKSHLG